jgi:prolipoprotein diacylglyceryltransferase
MGLYAVERFLLEIVRAKDDRFLLGLSTSQLLSALLLIGAAVLWQRQRQKPDWNPQNAPASAVFKPKAKPA